MKKVEVFSVIIAMCLLTGGREGWAETMYVTDRLYLSVRAVPDEGQPQVALLESDTKVEVLETEGDWAKVTLQNGTTGWVMKKYLTKDPTASIALAQLQGDLEKKSETIDDLRGQVEEMSLRIAELEGQVKEKSRAIKEMESQSRVGSDPVSEHGGQSDETPLILERLREENASLKKDVSRLAALKVREAALKQEIKDLRRRLSDQNPVRGEAAENTSWMKQKAVYLIAVGCLVVGLFTGYLMRRPDRNRYYLR